MYYFTGEKVKTLLYKNALSKMHWKLYLLEQIIMIALTATSYMFYFLILKT